MAMKDFFFDNIQHKHTRLLGAIEKISSIISDARFNLFESSLIIAALLANSCLTLEKFHIPSDKYKELVLSHVDKILSDYHNMHDNPLSNSDRESLFKELLDELRKTRPDLFD